MEVRYNRDVNKAIEELQNAVAALKRCGNRKYLGGENMFEIIQNVIKEGRYNLTELLVKIDTLWVQGSLTDEAKGCIGAGGASQRGFWQQY